MKQFVFYKKENYPAYTKTRPGETRLGETIMAVQNEKNWQHELKRSSAQFVIVGIPEDIGVRANLGTGGTHTAWNAFLASFFNIQQNDFLDGNRILLLGYFDFSGWQKELEGKPLEILRETTAKIDKLVAGVVKKIVVAGKIPVIIGGGHNNAYGNIKGTVLGLHETGRSKTASINVINLDAHTDFRILEGRHSGNGFSYAFSEGLLAKYAVLGAHENYIPAGIVEEIKRNKNLKVITYEELFVRQPNGWDESMRSLLSFTKNNFTGIELDMDAIENVLSSAVSPSGVTVARARQFIHRAASESKVAYLHICEGAAELSNKQKSSNTGKLIAYLVSDFIKAVK